MTGISDKELAALPPKATRFAEEVALYREHDFLEAYALHTDKRIRETGPHAAIGGGDNWEAHGKLQFDFLCTVGLKPGHRLLEIGCGTGRLARKIVPYLERSNYLGVDISTAAVRAAQALAVEEGWDSRCPHFYVGSPPWFAAPVVDYAWAYSVFIHLPPEHILEIMRAVAAVLAPAGRFFWSFVPEAVTVRTGLKQFRATLEVYRMCAVAAGLTFEQVPDWIAKAGHEPGRVTGSQRMAVSRLAAPAA